MGSRRLRSSEELAQDSSTRLGQIQISRSRRGPWRNDSWTGKALVVERLVVAGSGGPSPPEKPENRRALEPLGARDLEEPVGTEGLSAAR